MTTPDVNTLKKDNKHVYISWNYVYLSPPPTINYKTGKYQLPHNNVNMSFNSLIHYPSIARLDKIKRSSLESEGGIRSDHFKNYYTNLKKNKEFFMDIREIANSIPNLGVKITKDDKDKTPHFIIPVNKFHNVYNVIVLYTNNDKIPMILSKTDNHSITFMSNIDKSKKRINIFKDVNKQFCLNQNKQLSLAHLIIDYETIFYLCTKYVPCLDLIHSKIITKNFQIH